MVSKGEVKQKALQGLGVFVVTGIAGITAWLGPKYPFLAPLNTLISWWVGKLLGVPLDSVIQDAVKRMEPAKQVDMTVTAVQSLPRETQKAVADDVLERIAQQSVRSMPPKQAMHMTRALLETIDPAEKARILEQIVFVSSHPPSAKPEADASEPNVEPEPDVSDGNKPDSPDNKPTGAT